MTKLRVLILGGYGTFGGRLAQLLATDARLHLLIAGRSPHAAEEFCRELTAGAERSALAVDRDGDAAAQLASGRPDLVIDATGPFQGYGTQPYRLIEACIANRVPYLDLADGADFVAGVGAFDAAAKQAGIYVISGASSFPALSAAVLRVLGQGIVMDKVSVGIAPSPYAGVGPNVIRAIASYAGKPIRRLKGGQLGVSYPLIDSMRYTVAPPGALPLRDIRFSLVDVPELQVLPQLWPALQSVFVGAGPVPAVLHRALTLLAWLVRLRLLPSLEPFAPLFHRVTNTLRWGEHRGGMFVELEGRDPKGTPLRRSWHLLAEGGDGPLIPSMAAAALVRRVLDGRPPAPGARSAATALELADYDFFFAGRQIVTGRREDRPADAAQPLYRTVLQSAFDELPPTLRAMHDRAGLHRAAGMASVERGRGLLANALAWLMGFPKTASQVPVEVTFAITAGRELWTRNFAGRRFRSVQSAGRGRWRGLLAERFGPLSVGLAVLVKDGTLGLVVRRWSLFGLPMPRWLAPGGHGIEREVDGRFTFDVEIAAPWVGRLVHYRVWLAPA